jgi:hypothetical protein
VCVRVLQRTPSPSASVSPRFLFLSCPVLFLNLFLIC